MRLLLIDMNTLHLKMTFGILKPAYVYSYSIKTISMHILLRMNVMLDFSCIGITICEELTASEKFKMKKCGFSLVRTRNLLHCKSAPSTTRRFWQIMRCVLKSLSLKAIIAVTLVVTDFMTNVPKWFY